METKNLIFGLAIAVFCYIAVDFLKSKGGDGPQEPPKLGPRIPLIGHVVGMVQKGARYIGSTGTRTKNPIFTLDFLASKIYVVNTSSAVAAIQRNSKLIIFDPFIDSAADRMAGIKGAGLTLLSTDDTGGGGLNKKIVKAMHPSLLGPGLDAMNRAMIGNLRGSLDGLEKVGEEGDGVMDLYAWVRHAISVASADAVWGEGNPLKDPEVEKAFWDFDSHLGLLILKIFPSITARKAYLGREKVVAAFVKYYSTGQQNRASDLAKARWNVQHENGATIEDISRLETATVSGVLSNTSPSCFWMLFDIYSRPSLLAQLRQEVQQNCLVENQETGDLTIDLAALRDACPLLLATFQEALRFHSNSSPTRFITKDVVVTCPTNDDDDTSSSSSSSYLLKKGRVLFMPSQLMNFEPSIWGHDSQTFNPSRFAKETLKQRPTSFMSFGASPSLCPGRHFASGEILGMTAMMILRFEIEPVAGKWEVPRFQRGAMAASMPSPADEVNVRVKVREEFKGRKWEFGLTEGKGKFGLITG